MTGPVQLLLALFLCGIGLSVCGAWFVLRRGRTGGWPDGVDTPGGVRRRKQRRTLGMAIVALLSVGTAAGLVAVDPEGSPGSFAAYWMAILGLVMWLCGLATVDVLHTIQVQRRWAETRSRAALEDYLRCLQSENAPPEED